MPKKVERDYEPVIFGKLELIKDENNDGKSIVFVLKRNEPVHKSTLIKLTNEFVGTNVAVEFGPLASYLYFKDVIKKAEQDKANRIDKKQ